MYTLRIREINVTMATHAMRTRCTEYNAVKGVDIRVRSCSNEMK